MENIKEKVIIVTGASSGIGKAISLALASEGARVVLGARRTEHLEMIVDEISAAGGEAVFLKADVKKKDDLVQLVKMAMETYGKLDVIVNNSGISQLSRIDELDVDGWEEMIDINLKGVLYGMAAAIPVFKQQQSGHIVNIISTSGIKIVPMQGVYAGDQKCSKNHCRSFQTRIRRIDKDYGNLARFC